MPLLDSLVPELRQARQAASAAKEAKDAATALHKAAEARVQVVSDQIIAELSAKAMDGGEPVAEGAFGRVRLQRSKPSVVVVNAGLLPPEYLRQKPAPPPEPDKDAIGKALAAGVEVPGVILADNWSVRTE